MTLKKCRLKQHLTHSLTRGKTASTPQGAIPYRAVRQSQQSFQREPVSGDYPKGGKFYIKCVSVFPVFAQTHTGQTLTHIK